MDLSARRWDGRERKRLLVVISLRHESWDVWDECAAINSLQKVNPSEGDLSISIQIKLTLKALNIRGCCSDKTPK